MRGAGARGAAGALLLAVAPGRSAAAPPALPPRPRAGAVMRRPQVAQAVGTETGAETRIDRQDGQRKTKQMFFNAYSDRTYGLDAQMEWDYAAPTSMCVDDGAYKTQQQFIDKYGGTTEWQQACAVAGTGGATPAISPAQTPDTGTDPQATGTERRRDSDGQYKTRQQFIYLYGGTAEWEGAAATAVTQPPRPPAPPASTPVTPVTGQREGQPGAGCADQWVDGVWFTCPGSSSRARGPSNRRDWQPWPGPPPPLPQPLPVSRVLLPPPALSDNDNENDKDGTKMWWPWVLGGVLICLGICAAVVIIALRSRGGKGGKGGGKKQDGGNEDWKDGSPRSHEPAGKEQPQQLATSPPQHSTPQRSLLPQDSRAASTAGGTGGMTSGTPVVANYGGESWRGEVAYRQSDGRYAVNWEGGTHSFDTPGHTLKPCDPWHG